MRLQDIPMTDRHGRLSSSRVIRDRERIPKWPVDTRASLCLFCVEIGVPFFTGIESLFVVHTVTAIKRILASTMCFANRTDGWMKLYESSLVTYLTHDNIVYCP